MKHFPSFSNWSSTFKQSELGKLALEGLKELELDDTSAFNVLKQRVLKACYMAAKFHVCQLEDGFEELNNKAHEFRNRNYEIVEAIQKLEELHASFPFEFSIGLKSSFEGLIADEFGNREKPQQYNLVFKNILFNLRSWAEQTEYKPSGCIAACLEYPKDIRNQASKPHHIQNGLMFELALVFRHWRNGQLEPIPNVSLMPTDGRPHYSQIAAFHNAVFSTSARLMDGEKVKDRLRKLLDTYPEAHFVGWGIEES